MNIWSYGVSMGLLWCILKLLCIASLYHDKCTNTKNFQIHGIFNGFLQLLRIPSLYCAVNSQHPRAVSNHASTVWKNEKTTRETHDAVQNPYSTLVTLCDGDVHTTKPYSRLTADEPFVFATNDFIARGLSSYAGSLLPNYIILPQISQNLQSSKLYLVMYPIMFSISWLTLRYKKLLTVTFFITFTVDTLRTFHFQRKPNRV